MLWVSTLAMVSVLLTATNSVSIRVVYDDFFVNSVHKYWKESLELLLRQLELQHGRHRVQVEKFHPTHGKDFVLQYNATATLFLTSCAHSLHTRHYGAIGSVLSLDSTPCKQGSSNAVPLTWSQENWFCFYARFQKWSLGYGALLDASTGNTLQSNEEKFDLSKRCKFKWQNTRYATVKSTIESAKLHVKGKNVPTGVANINPSSLVTTNANNTVINFRGNVRNLTDLLFCGLRGSYSPIISADRSMGFYRNGSWNGLIGMMLSGEVEFGAAPYYLTEDRYNVVDYSAIIYDSVNTIIIRAPQEETKLWTAISIFNWEVWICLIFSMIAFAGTTWLSFRFYRVQSNEFAYHILYFFRVIIGQGNDLRSIHFTAKILAAIWCLAAVVLVNVYTSTLTSSSLVPYFRPAADSLEDLVYKSDLKPLAKSGTSWETIIMSSNLEAMKVVAQKAQSNPAEFWVSSNEMAIKRVLTGKYAFLSTQGLLQYEVASDFDIHKRCRLYITKRSFSKEYLAGIMPKNGPANKAYTYGIIGLNQHGWVNYWDLTGSTRSKPGTIACVKPKTETNVKLLKLTDLASAFLLLGIGVLTSLALLICEHLARFC